MVPIIEETYDALPLSAESWDVFEGEADAAIVDEVLTVSVDLADSSSSAYWWSVSTATIPAAGVAGLELHLVPEPQDPGEIAVGLHDQTRYPFLDVFDGQIYALVREPDDSFTILDAIEWDPDMHRWIRLRWDANADTIDFETSFDAQIWTSFHTMTPTGFDFDQAHYDLGAGAWEGPFSADPFVAFDNAFLCEG